MYRTCVDIEKQFNLPRGYVKLITYGPVGVDVVFDHRVPETTKERVLAQLWGAREQRQVSKRTAIQAVISVFDKVKSWFH